MTLQQHPETSRVDAHPEKTLSTPLLACAALIAVAALLAAPSMATASPRDSIRDAPIVMSVGHPRHGHRHGRAYDHHYRGRVEYARRYASQATAQASTAWRFGCARSGPRWSTDWNDHYFWALNARPRELRRELDRRDDRLRDCRVRHHYGHRSYRPH